MLKARVVVGLGLGFCFERPFSIPAESLESSFLLGDWCAFFVQGLGFRVQGLAFWVQGLGMSRV